MERNRGQTSKRDALSCAASSWEHFDPLHKWNLSPFPPTPQYYSVHVYKPRSSFWWHTYTDISFWPASPSWLTLRLTGRRVWQHWPASTPQFLFIHLFYSSSPSLILSQTRTHFLEDYSFEKQHATPSRKYCGVKVHFSTVNFLLSSFSESIYWLTVIPIVPPSFSSDSVSVISRV